MHPRAGKARQQPRSSGKRKARASSLSPIRPPARKNAGSRRALDLDEAEPIDLTNERCGLAVAQRRQALVRA